MPHLRRQPARTPAIMAMAAASTLTTTAAAKASRSSSSSSSRASSEGQPGAPTEGRRVDCASQGTDSTSDPPKEPGNNLEEV